MVCCSSSVLCLGVSHFHVGCYCSHSSTKFLSLIHPPPNPRAEPLDHVSWSKVTVLILCLSLRVRECPPVQSNISLPLLLDFGLHGCLRFLGKDGSAIMLPAARSSLPPVSEPSEGEENRSRLLP